MPREVPINAGDMAGQPRRLSSGTRARCVKGRHVPSGAALGGELADRLQRPGPVALSLPRLALPHLQVAEAMAALGAPASRDMAWGVAGGVGRGIHSRTGRRTGSAGRSCSGLAGRRGRAPHGWIAAPGMGRTPGTGCPAGAAARGRHLGRAGPHAGGIGRQASGHQAAATGRTGGTPQRPGTGCLGGRESPCGGPEAARTPRGGRAGATAVHRARRSRPRPRTGRPLGTAPGTPGPGPSRLRSGPYAGRGGARAARAGLARSVRTRPAFRAIGVRHPGGGGPRGISRGRGVRVPCRLSPVGLLGDRADAAEVRRDRCA